MSWSFSAAGKKKAVLKKIAEQLSKPPMHNEPEQKIKENLLEAARIAAEGHTDNQFIMLEASGSASSYHESDPEKAVRNQSCLLEIKQLYGYTEEE